MPVLMNRLERKQSPPSRIILHHDPDPDPDPGPNPDPNQQQELALQQVPDDVSESEPESDIEREWYSIRRVLDERVDHHGIRRFLVDWESYQGEKDEPEWVCLSIFEASMLTQIHLAEC